MKISRRNFVAALSASLVAGIPAASVVAGTGRDPSLQDRQVGLLGGDALSRMTWNTFFPYIGTEFEFASGTRRRSGSVARLRLSEMTSLIGNGKVDRTEPACFQLTFRGRADADVPRLSQNTYPVEHFALGRFDLFISDAGLVEGEYVYTAIINRVTE